MMKQGKVICIANRKGGVGKTTTAHALVCGLVERGRSVLAIDADGQCNLTDVFGVDAESGVCDILTQGAKAADVIVPTAHGAELIPATVALEMAEAEMPVDALTVLRDALNTVKKDYDYIVIDTPPSAGLLTLNALTAADSLIIPAQADAATLEGIRQFAGTIDGVRIDNPKLRIDGILLTRHSARARLTRQMAELIAEAAADMQTKVYNHSIREGIAAKEAYALRRPIFDIKSKVAEDYEAWIDEVISDEQ